jgi:NAD(P)-dependent dehydrogenase (short-subunit alcohol dehydrogenase family)
MWQSRKEKFSSIECRGTSFCLTTSTKKEGDDMIDLSGYVALVTGAASEKGIGQAIARALAAQGARIAVGDIDEAGAKRLAEVIAGEGGVAEPYILDVTQADSVESTVNAIVRSMGSVDILVNNAGITQPIKVRDMTLEDWNRVMTVNATGAFLCSKAVIARMEERGWGRIINISSVSAKRGGGIFGGAHYSAAKAAMLGFAKALAREVASLGITVNSVAPGLILTDIRGGVESEQEQRKMSKDIPVARVGLPEEVAAAVCFLASTEAAYITGEEIDINGGSHMD